MRLWELDQTIQRYPGLISPSNVMRLSQRLVENGLHEEHAFSICLDFDMAVAHFGRWVDTRLKETVERDAPRSKSRPKVQVPKYKTMAQVLGLDADPNRPDEDGFSHDEMEAIRGTVDDLRRDPAALAEYLNSVS